MKTVYFGQYPQNGPKPEPLEWIVLYETEQEILLLCKYSIATKGFVFDYYHESYEYRKCLWEYSDLRQWLNEEFYAEAFSREQQQRILTTEIKTLSNDVETLKTFENKVFLLSKEQVEQYLVTPELRKGTRTINAANDPKVLSSDRKKLENIPWWILPHIDREGSYSIGTGKDKNKHFSYIAYPQMVFDQGTQYHGRNFMHIDWSVRPAIRVSKINKSHTLGMKLLVGGKEVTKDQIHQVIEEYEQKMKSPEYQKEIKEISRLFESVEKNKTTWCIGDITDFCGDCIVNAANTSLLGGGGVNGAIHKVAGPDLLDACRKLGGCKTGEAKLTAGFGLKSQYIIHTVGPIYPKNASYEDIQLCEKQLRNCYTNAMNLAKKYGIQTIAFPSISTGAYGYPKEDATLIALDAVAEWKRCNQYWIDVRFYCYNAEMYQIYEQANKKQQKRYEYRKITNLDKTFKLDHVRL